MNSRHILLHYLRELTTVALQGDAREESYYPVLAGMLGDVAGMCGHQDVHVTTLPKPTDAGNPDFRLWRGTQRIIGYVEAKKPTEERLDVIEGSEQLKRYRSTFQNLILTNFLEFRRYRNGELVQAVRLARPLILNRLRTTPPIENPNELFDLLEHFLGFSLPKVFTAESLAIELAKGTRFLRDVVAQSLCQEQTRPSVLSGFFEAFQTYLIGSLTAEDFADLFSQTITYGLFAARTRAGDGFGRRAAFDNIPHTIGVLRDLFRFISLDDLPAQLAWCVDDIAEIMAIADVPDILARYYRAGKGTDPIVHFYETFLAQYDPTERERRGVYYTPEPVVSYIVRSLHALLKTEFDKPDGLATDGVTLLDPAAGTMTFVARAAEQAVHEFVTKYGAGAREEFIRRHVLANFCAFELMMAPYAVGHLKMGFFLEELGHRLAADERVRFYLTNTLDNEELLASRLPGLSALSEESHLAGKVKKETPILVILGNPPYSGISANMGKWITGLIEDYKQVDGRHFGEKKHWLQDDYVKFLRFAQWKIEQTGCGVVAMITNHGYLDNPTFRGMRQSLMHSFDSIYVLDLHGNKKKKEICPGGGSDQNVFDIQQGVTIGFFVRRCGSLENHPPDAVVRHADLWGMRDAKYSWLCENDLAQTDWSELKPKSPLYLFIPTDKALESSYQRFVSISEIFPVHSVGIVTARDRLTIHFSPEEVWTTVTVFSRMDPELARETYGLRGDVRDWKVVLAQKDLVESGPIRGNITPILYRPFDTRHTYYTGQSRGFIGQPQRAVTNHMLAGENVALISPKRVEYAGTWQHAFVSSGASDHVAVSLKTVDYTFPLYCYPSTESQRGLFARTPNLNPRLVAALRVAIGREVSPEEVFHYVYATLYAPTYREKYEELLRRNFPRVPFTADENLFSELAALGGRLAAIHLLKSPELDSPACTFRGEGDRAIKRDRKLGLRYESGAQRVYINETQHFAPVPEDVWQFHIGGYQIAEKWLKDRQDRQLQLAEIRAYCRIVSALGLTMDFQQEIDELFSQVEHNLPSDLR